MLDQLCTKPVLSTIWHHIKASKPRIEIGPRIHVVEQQTHCADRHSIVHGNKSSRQQLPFAPCAVRHRIKIVMDRESAPLSLYPLSDCRCQVGDILQPLDVEIPHSNLLLPIEKLSQHDVIDISEPTIDRDCLSINE